MAFFARRRCEDQTVKSAQIIEFAGVGGMSVARVIAKSAEMAGGMRVR